MFTERLAQRRFVFDGEDRKVEVWWRHDGFFVVSSLRRRDPQNDRKEPPDPPRRQASGERAARERLITPPHHRVRSVGCQQKRQVWVEVRNAIEYSEAAALITAALWMREAQGEMP